MAIEQHKKFFDLVERKVLVPNLNEKDYIIGKFNLLKNVNECGDQLPHFDYPYQLIR